MQFVCNNYTPTGEVLVCNYLSITECFMCLVLVARNLEVDFSHWLLTTILVYLFHSNRSLHGETPVGIAFRSGNTDLIDLLDKDHLLPRNDDKRLETFIVTVRHMCQSKKKKRLRKDTDTNLLWLLQYVIKQT